MQLKGEHAYRDCTKVMRKNKSQWLSFYYLSSFLKNCWL
jgi:hypothetical protein